MTPEASRNGLLGASPNDVSPSIVSGPLRRLYKKLRRATETRRHQRHRRRRTVATTTTTISLFLSDLRYTLRAQRLTETTIESFMRSIVVVKVVVVESGSGEDAVRDEEWRRVTSTPSQKRNKDFISAKSVSRYICVYIQSNLALTSLMGLENLSVK